MTEWLFTFEQNLFGRNSIDKFQASHFLLQSGQQFFQLRHLQPTINTSLLHLVTHLSGSS